MEDKIQRFLSFLEAEKGYADNTIAAYRNDLKQFIDYLETSVPDYTAYQFKGISKSHILDFIKHLREHEYTSSTIARKVAAIKSFFHFMLAEGQLKEDPSATLDSPKVKKRLPMAISKDDVDRLLAAPRKDQSIKGYRDLALLEVLYASGMRVTELVSLNLDDIVDDNCIRVGSRKTASSKERIIPISPSAAEALRLYLERTRLQLARHPDERSLFLNHRGKRLTRQGLWLIIKHYVDEVCISAEVTPHTLRHSFAAHKLSQGKSLQDIQKLLGHANISTTQIYTHLAKEGEKTY
jgi:integrase/recombinase XerD